MHAVSGALSLPSRGAFHLSLTVLIAIGHPLVFSLGGWSPRFQAGFHVPRPTQDTAKREDRSLKACHLLRGGLSIPLQSQSSRHAAVLQPRDRSRFGLLPVRSPLLGESRLMSSPPVTWMFRFTGLASRRLCVRPRDARVAPRGLSHSESPESRAFCASSGIFAACRVLRRRRMPRHPPCAFLCLIPSFQRYSSRFA